MSKPLRHDTAFALATVLLELVRPSIRPVHHSSVHAAFYATCLTALERYEVKRDRMALRLDPSNN